MATAITSYKEKYEAIKARARGHAHRIWGGVKGTAMDAGVGAGVGALLDAVKDIDTLKGPYRKAGALIIGGHLLKKKSHDAGTVMAGIGGLKAYLDYTNKSLVGEPSATTPAKGIEEGDVGGMEDEDAGAYGRRRRRHRQAWERFGGGFGGEMRGGVRGIDDEAGLED